MANSLTSTGLTLGSPQYAGSTTISGIEVMGGGSSPKLYFGSGTISSWDAPKVRSHGSVNQNMTFEDAVSVTHTLPSINVGTGNTYLAGCAKEAYHSTNLAGNKYYLPAGGQYMVGYTVHDWSTSNHAGDLGGCEYAIRDIPTSLSFSVIRVYQITSNGNVTNVSTSDLRSGGSLISLVDPSVSNESGYTMYYAHFGCQYFRVS